MNIMIDSESRKRGRIIIFDSQIFGKNLRALRKQDGFRLIDIAVFLNIHETYLGQIERGTLIPSVDTAIALANYFEMDFKTLLSPLSQEYGNTVFLRQKIFNII